MLEAKSGGVLDFTQTIELEIDGEWYSWQTRGVPGYQMADISPFTSRTSTGQVKLSDLVGIAVLEQSGWVTGAGQFEFIETARYAYGDGVWTPNGRIGATLGPYYEHVSGAHGTSGATSMHYHDKYAKVVPISKPFYGRTDTSLNPKSFYLLSNSRNIYVGTAEEELDTTTTEITGDLLTTPIVIPFPNHDFEDSGSGTPNWFVDEVDTHLTGSVAIATIGGNKWLQVQVQESSPGTALVGEKYAVAGEYIPVPTDNAIQYTVHIEADVVSAPSDWTYKVEVYPVIYDTIAGQYVRGTPYSETIPVAGVGPVSHTTSAFTPAFEPFSASSSTIIPSAPIHFLEIRLVVEVANTSPAATEIRFDLVELKVASTNHVFAYDLYYNGITLLAGTNFGILYCENIADALENGTAMTWKRVNEFAIVPAISFATYDGLLWYAEADTPILHYGANPNGEDLEARTVNNTHPAYWFSKDGSTGLGDAGAIIVGDPTDRIVKIHEYNNKLWVFKEKSIYYIYNNSGVYTPVKYADHDYHEWNFSSVTYYDGALVFWKNGRVYRFLESSIVDITPPPLDEYTYMNDLKQVVKGFTTVGPYLYALDGQGNLVVFDGAGWHSSVNLWTVSSAILGGWSGAFVGNSLTLFGIYSGTGAPPTPRSSLLCVAVDENGPTEAYRNKTIPETAPNDGYIVTSWIDGGLPNIDKHFHSIVVEAAFELESDYIDVEFLVDDGEGNYRNYGPKRIEAPHYVANPSPFGRTIVDRRLYKVELPNDFVGKRIQVKFTLSVGDGVSGTYGQPHLWRWLLNYVPRPWTIYGYAPTLLLTPVSKTRNNMVKQWSVQEQIDLLLKARDSRAPMRMRDPISGEIKEVYLSAIKIQPLIRRTPNSALDETYMAELSLVEFKI
ncbi:hypothetical protein D6833_09005 [Candidatus Parcubacteria bacterium]|nr:MAG: hypothetical protein D6833_09005 [Candidatus Parcubacteria bacterium]